MKAHSEEIYFKSAQGT